MGFRSVAFGYRELSISTSDLVIHDFVRVELPFDAVLGAFTYFISPELIADLVAQEWRRETAEVGRVLSVDDRGSAALSVEARLGTRRPREGAVVMPLSWSAVAAEWVPGLDADLEVVSFGPERTHLHVLGRSRLPINLVPGTEEASLDHRLAVALVRGVLTSLADVLVECTRDG